MSENDINVNNRPEHPRATVWGYIVLFILFGVGGFWDYMTTQFFFRLVLSGAQNGFLFSVVGAFVISATIALIPFTLEFILGDDSIFRPFILVFFAIAVLIDMSSSFLGNSVLITGTGDRVSQLSDCWAVLTSMDGPSWGMCALLSVYCIGASFTIGYLLRRLIAG